MIKPINRSLYTLAILGCTMSLMWILAEPVANYLRMPGDLWGSVAAQLLAAVVGLQGFVFAARCYTRDK